MTISLDPCPPNFRGGRRLPLLSKAFLFSWTLLQMLLVVLLSQPSSVLGQECDNLLVKIENESKEQIETLRRQLLDENIALNDCQGKVLQIEDRESNAIHSLQSQLQEYQTKLTQEEENMKRQKQAYQNEIDEIRRASNKSEQYERTIADLTEQKKNALMEKKTLQKELNIVKEELVLVRRALFYANEELRKPAERRQHYKRMVIEFWDAVQERYFVTKEFAQPYFEIAQTFYFDNVEPHRLSLLESIQPQIGSIKEQIMPFVNEIKQQGREKFTSATKSAHQFWMDTAPNRQKAIEQVVPYLIEFHSRAVDVVNVAADLILSLLKFYNAPYPFIHVATEFQERTVDAVVFTEIIAVLFILVSIFKFIVHVLFFRSKSHKVLHKDNDQQLKKSTLKLQNNGNKNGAKKVTKVA